MTPPDTRDSHPRRAEAGRRLAMILACGVMAVSSGHAADSARIRRTAAELDAPRRDWTICTVNDIGRAVQRDRTADATAIADGALARCGPEERALRTKAAQLLGAAAAQRMMERLTVEAREALIGSARTMQATLATGDDAEPAWPRVLAPTR